MHQGRGGNQQINGSIGHTLAELNATNLPKRLCTRFVEWQNTDGSPQIGNRRDDP
jgi:hypothetical protein